MSSSKSNFLKHTLSLIILSVLIAPTLLFSSTASAQSLGADDLWGNAAIQTNVQNATGLGNKDPREIAASVIRVVLGFLGIIAVLIILYAGFLWMTAAGNDDKIATAKGMMSAGVIGLVIILAAFGIATFVMNALVNATA